MKTNIAISCPIPPNAASRACAPSPMMAVAQNENTQSSGRWEASMPRIATVASMIRLDVSTERPTDIVSVTRSVWVR